MFHHFHNNTHPPGQGSIGAEELEALIKFVGKSRILTPQEWVHHALEGKLDRRDLCFTFDDGLKCQMDIALPVLEAHGIKAFWFVYSSPLAGKAEPLEIYRHFRSTHYKTVESFYADFFLQCEKLHLFNEIQSKLEQIDIDSYLHGFPFYTTEDRKFRFVRDQILGVSRYNSVMDSLLIEKNYDRSLAAQNLWLNTEDLKHLQKNGHVIGLHSNSHPTAMSKLTENEQREEYTLNFNFLKSALGKAPNTMSHPCNSYTDKTLSLLKELGVTLGFRANLEEIPNRSVFEIPREDHANIVKQMEMTH
jgi:peptidoglycan/xylan/chitin deacetylase (PgdA/CDA1 family)